MWTLWAFPLLAASFLAGLGVAAAWYLASRKGERPSAARLVALPLGCVALPIAAFLMLAIVGNILQSSDTELYEEVFARRPTIGEDRMLFDDFGRGRDREIFMRAEPTEAERAALLSIPNARETEFTLDDFVARGIPHGFTWWLSRDVMYPGFCRSARILDAHGFNGWEEFRMAECVDAGPDFPASANKGRIYVIASGRAD